MTVLDLDNAQKENVGLNFVLQRLTCCSPYGLEEIKQIAPFAAKGEEGLLECFDNMEKLSTLSKDNPDIIDELCGLLAHFKNIRGAMAKLKSAYLNQVELFEIKSFLLVFEQFLSVFDKTNKEMRLAGINFASMEAALNILDPHNKRITPFSIEDGFSPALPEIRREKGRVETLMRIEANQNRREELLAQRADIVAMEDVEEMRVMMELSQGLREHITVFCNNMDNIGKLDFIIAKTLLALKYGATRPKVGGKKLVLKDMNNPMIAEILAATGKEFTATSLDLDVGTTIITGANMGGKSVAMRTAVLNIMLCRMGFFVFVKHAEIPLFDGVCLVSEDMQNAHQGLSSFGAEISCLGHIINRSKKEFLFIALDELARATNPQEGAAIVRAVAAYLAYSGCICLMSTHYDGVVRPDMKHYQVAGLAANIDNVASIESYMDYSLVEANPAAQPPRDALRICKLLGLDDDLMGIIDKEIN